VRPKRDEASDWTYNIGEQVRTELINCKLDFCDHGKSKANRTAIEKCVKANGVNVVLFFGHGTRFTLVGNAFSERSHSCTPIIDPLNVKELCIDFIFSLACNSARGLGIYASKYNPCVRTFIGWNGPVALPVVFGNYPDQIARALCSGLEEMIRNRAPAQKAIDIMKTEMDHVILKLAREVYKADLKVKANPSTKNAVTLGDALITMACAQSIKDYMYLGGDKRFTLY